MTRQSADGTALHHGVVDAAPATVYRLVAGVHRWPAIFEPCVHARHLERGRQSERIQLWARVNEVVHSWTSRRWLDPAGLRIQFEQERSHPPVSSMGGQWEFRGMANDRTEIVLSHRYRVLGGDQELGTMSAAVDANSSQELAGLARVAEQGYPVEQLIFTFADRVRLRVGASGAYRFVAAAGRWPQLLSHVTRADLREDPAGVQELEMDTVTSDGAAHRTRSIRICFPPSEIVYKQLRPPVPLLGHSGSWRFGAGSGGVAIARHTVALDSAAIAGALGPAVTVAEARAHLREVLAANSRATLAAAVSAGAEAGAAAPA